MKLFKIWKILKTNKIPRKERTELKLIHNQIEIEKLVLIINKSHHETYKELRHFKTPQYDVAYLMRNKKGFNTLGFQQNYDVIATDYNGMILETYIDVNIDHISEKIKNSFNVYFMVVGSINFYNLKKKDRLQVTRSLHEKFKFNIL